LSSSRFDHFDLEVGGAMLRCNKQKLSAYVDGELSAAQKRRIQKHLQECDQCALELKKLQKAMASLKPAKSAKLSATKRRALHAAIAQSWKEKKMKR
jgi:anti-sigma factor RsiW